MNDYTKTKFEAKLTTPIIYYFFHTSRTWTIHVNHAGSV